MELKCVTLFFGKSRALIEVRRPKKRITLVLDLVYHSIRAFGTNTVKLVSCGPDVARGKCPNFDIFFDIPLALRIWRNID